MKRYILVVAIFITALLTGFTENQDMNNDKDYEMNLSELKKTIAEKYELEKDLNDAEIKIKALEKKIKNLEEELGKQNKEKIEKGDLTSEKVLRIIDADKEALRYVFDEASISTQSVSIIGSNIDNLVENYEELRIKGLGSGEYLKAEVIGSIHDFQLIEVGWDEKTNKLVEVKVIHELDEIRNQTIYIETYLPCGIPCEKIKWKDSQGDTHEILLTNDGYGFDGSIIWSN